MIVESPISLGELVDKLSILQIKMNMIEDREALVHVRHEEQLLSQKLESLNLPNINDHLIALIEVNSLLWKIEDEIRELEKAQQFDSEFVELARNVYKTNDQRFILKRAVNETFGSDVQEVKSYKG
jgi:hypothetical protein